MSCVNIGHVSCEFNIPVLVIVWDKKATQAKCIFSRDTPRGRVRAQLFQPWPLSRDTFAWFHHAASICKQAACEIWYHEHFEVRFSCVFVFDTIFSSTCVDFHDRPSDTIDPQTWLERSWPFWILRTVISALSEAQFRSCESQMCREWGSLKERKLSGLA